MKINQISYTITYSRDGRYYKFTYLVQYELYYRIIAVLSYMIKLYTIL